MDYGARMTTLFSPFALGRLQLPNRIVMSPMTRSRAIGNLPDGETAKYYASRASAGLLITEGTSPSANGLGYARIPGCYSPAQVAGWRGVATAVHAAGGRIFIQLMHTGRVAAVENLPTGGRILAPSAIAAPGKMYTDAGGMQDHPVPAAMTEADITATRAEFVHASKSAIEAGLDGVELHGANGYLLEQFLNTASNQRTDGYGGSVENRARFVLEVARDVAAAIGADRLGIRLSPFGANGGMVADADTEKLYTYLATELGKLGLAYVHMVDHSAMGAPPVPPTMTAAVRKAFPGAYILSGGYDRERAEADLDAKKGDLVAFGRPFLSNPHLVQKLEKSVELLPPNPATFFTPGEPGYNDWPLA